MKKIPLSQGLFAYVDDADYAWTSRYKWCAAKIRNVFYAARNVPINDGGVQRQRTVYMHREIISAPKGMLVDHKDGDGLMNVRNNIRAVTNAENMNVCHYFNGEKLEQTATMTELALRRMRL